jgi:outer membrane protein TolC
LAVFKRDSEATKDRFAVGEVTNTDFARAKARALKAEMVVEALKNAAGLTDVKKGATGAATTAVPK